MTALRGIRLPRSEPLNYGFLRRPLLPSRRQMLPLSLAARRRSAAGRARDHIAAGIPPPVARRIIHSHVRPAGTMHPRCAECRIAVSLAARILTFPLLAQIGRKISAIRMIEPAG